MKKFICICLFSFSGFVLAIEGVFVINDVCDGFGCFPGDTGGRPITITQSGSYRLTSNLLSSSTTVNVIEINANNVTLDLNGFSIIGPKTCTGSNDTLVCSNVGMTARGVTSTSRFNIVVRNGIVKGFAGGIALAGLDARQSKISNITAIENEFGLIMGGVGAISNCILNNNERNGINGFLSTILVSDIVATGNGEGPVFIAAGGCSNVLFNNNGTATNNFCARYTNGSTCEGLIACP